MRESQNDMIGEPESHIPDCSKDEVLFVTGLVTLALVNVVVMLHFCSDTISQARRHHVSWQVAAAFEKHNSGDGSALPYRLLQPFGLDASHRDRKWPLLVFLHGAGERGSANIHQLAGLPTQMATDRWKRDFPCFLLAPQCPEQSDWSGQLTELERLIDKTCSSYPVDRSRIYLTGLSMGGGGTWQLGARCPETFAAIAPMCGVDDVRLAKRLADTPVWAFHGDADQTISVTCSRRMIEALSKVGATPKYTELKGVGHDCWTDSYAQSNGVIAWVFSQTRERQKNTGSTSTP